MADKANDEIGMASLEVLRASPGYPSAERLERGPVAVIECIQEIPCNPCESACRFDAILVGDPITNLPRLLEEKCRGCGECVPVCPGLAIFIVNEAYSLDEAAISIPYEYLPLPKAGFAVDALDRRGKRICTGRIMRVSNPERNDNTAVVTVIVPKRYSHQVRNFRIRDEKAGTADMQM